ncbi:MAG: rRNA maturation RNase YbeY [Bacteroidales bacterium]|nr:rRNA maturation RNase YbeY [Bacteroidales bacterium]
MEALAPQISFFTHDIAYTLRKKGKIRQWMIETAANERKRIGEISYMFGSDAYVLEINKQYLQHDFLTDIITFDDCEGDVLNGDMVISLERVRENAKTFHVSVEKELLRVLIHGILHLCGYKDKKSDEERQMREKEDFYIGRFYNNSLTTK